MAAAKSWSPAASRLTGFLQSSIPNRRAGETGEAKDFDEKFPRTL
jgi:hypothetical protein